MKKLKNQIKGMKRTIFILSIGVLLLGASMCITNYRQDVQIKEAARILNDLQESHNEYLMDFNQILRDYQGILKALLEKF